MNLLSGVPVSSTLYARDLLQTNKLSEQIEVNFKWNEDLCFHLHSTCLPMYTCNGLRCTLDRIEYFVVLNFYILARLTPIWASPARSTLCHTCMS